MRESAFACTHTHASGSDTGTEANAVERRLDVAFRNSASEITSFGGVPIRPPVHTRHTGCILSQRVALHCNGRGWCHSSLCSAGVSVRAP
jgi:hypothetical protein